MIGWSGLRNHFQQYNEEHEVEGFKMKLELPNKKKAELETPQSTKYTIQLTKFSQCYGWRLTIHEDDPDTAILLLKKLNRKMFESFKNKDLRTLIKLGAD